MIVFNDKKFMEALCEQVFGKKAIIIFQLPPQRVKVEHR